MKASYDDYAMPTYEYRCADGHLFELLQKMSDEPLSECPECGGPAERLLSGGAGLLFKGSGFYITDYRSKEYKDRSDSDAPAKKSVSPAPESGSAPKEGAS